MPAALEHLSVEVVVGAERFVELLGNRLDGGVLGEVEFELQVVGAAQVRDVEVVVEQSCQEVVRTRARTNTELVEDAVVLVQLAQLRFQWVVDAHGLHWVARLCHIPNLHTQEIAGENVLAVLAEGHVRNRADDLSEEVSGDICILLFKHLGSVIAGAGHSQIADLDDAFGGRKDELVVGCRVELRGRDHFRDVLVVLGLQVDDVERLRLVLQVPQVDSQVVGRNEILTVGAGGYAVDVVGVQVWERSL
jgi:hypothetical protein